MELREKFDSISLEAMQWAVAEDWCKLIEAASILGEDKNLKSDKALLIQVITAFYGVGILENIRFRQLFISMLPESRILSLASELTSKALENLEANQRNLANLRWSHRSKLVEIFANELKVPAIYLPSKFKTAPLNEDVVPVENAGELFDYQNEVVSKAEFLLQSGTKKFLIQLPTGSGKTRIIMELIKNKINETSLTSTSPPIIWLAHSAELLEQAISTFKKIWIVGGSRAIRVVRLYGASKLEELSFDDTIIFASLQKMRSLQRSKNKVFKKLVKETSLGVVDEAHKITAPTYSKVASELTISGGCLIGVTATPGRSAVNDYSNRSFSRFFDSKLIKPDLGKFPVEELRNRGILSELSVDVLDTGLGFDCELSKSSEDFSSRSIRRVGKSKRRNLLIINSIRREVDASRPTIVFSCSLEHSELLCAALALFGIKAAHVSHIMSRNARHNIIDNFKEGKIDVIINYGILSTGFDAPNVKTVIITRPTTSIVLYSQMIGRGLRGPKVGGTKNCRLIDLRDNIVNFKGVNYLNNYFDEYWLK